MLEALISSMAAFAATNLDDILILMMLFAQTNNRTERSSVAAGQFVGVAVLTAGSLLGAAGLGLVPEQYLRFLGLIPILLGIRAWWSHEEAEAASVSGPGMWSTAALTIANGGDNLGVYVPLFAGFKPAQMAVAGVVFAVMTVLWCLLAGRLAVFPRIKELIGRWKGAAVSVVLAALGLAILLG